MYSKLFLFLNFRHLRGQWVRTLLSLLGMIVGVAAFVFVFAISTTIYRSVDVTTDDLSGRAQLEVRGGSAGFDEEVITAVREADGIELAAPLSTSGGII